MKTKKILLAITAMALVACTAVVGTLAYLTASDSPVKNSFTLAANITVQLKEETPTDLGEASATGTEDTGFTYENVIPGQTLSKTPYITVKSDVASYMFIKVEGISADVSLTDIDEITTNGWTLLESEDHDALGNGIYYRAFTAEQADNTTKYPIFSSVTVSSGTESLTDKDITISVTGIQQSGFDTVALAFAEAPAFQTVD